MVDPYVPSGEPGGNPDILLKLTGLTEVRARVGVDVDLRCVEVQLLGLHGDWRVLLAPMPALDLAFRVAGAVCRLNRLEDAGGQAPFVADPDASAGDGQ